MIVFRLLNPFPIIVLFVIVVSTSILSICEADIDTEIGDNGSVNSDTKENIRLDSNNNNSSAPLSTPKLSNVDSLANDRKIENNQKARQLFMQGTKAYQQGDYSLAADFFLSARDFGLDIPRLYFNLGSSYFKLSQYSAASDAFINSAVDPQLAVLSRINLGLCAIKMNKTHDAESYLQSALALVKSDKYRQQILTLMEKQGFEASNSNPTQGWHSQVALMLGHNSNVTLYEIEQAGSEQKDDDYLHTILNGSYQTNITPSGRLTLDANIQTINYQKLNEYDYTTGNLQPSFQQQIGSWNIKLAGSYQTHYLDGTYFLISRSLRNRIQYRINAKWDISADFADTLHTDRHNNYDYLSGAQLQQTYQLNYNTKHIAFQLYYQLEQNNRHDLPMQSYSPKRWRTGLQLSYTLSARQTLSFAMDHRNSRYPQDTDSVINRREDRRDSYTLRYSIMVHTTTHAFVSYNAITNRSNLTDYEYDYSSGSLIVGLSWHI